jgi:hypothetical protein
MYGSNKITSFTLGLYEMPFLIYSWLQKYMSSVSHIFFFIVMLKSVTRVICFLQNRWASGSSLLIINCLSHRFSMCCRSSLTILLKIRFRNMNSSIRICLNTTALMMNILIFSFFVGSMYIISLGLIEDLSISISYRSLIRIHNPSLSIAELIEYLNSTRSSKIAKRRRLAFSIS